jgi:hypothetical protein
MTVKIEGNYEINYPTLTATTAVKGGAPVYLCSSAAYFEPAAVPVFVWWPLISSSARASAW